MTTTKRKPRASTRTVSAELLDDLLAVMDKRRPKIKPFDFSEAIRRLQLAREEKGLSAKAADRLAGVALGSCRLIERGRRPDVSFRVVALLAWAIGVDLDWVSFGVGPKWVSKRKRTAWR